MLRVESYKRGIVLSAGFNILNKGAVFLNGLLVAYFFGASQFTDFFFYIYNSVAILGVFFTSMNSSVLIPESMRIRNQEGNDKAIAFLNFFIWLYGALMAVVLLAVLFDPVSFFLSVSNFDAGQIQSSRILLYLSLPLFVLIPLINLLVDILASYKFFAIPMIVGLINGTVSIIFIILFHSGAGIQSVFYGLIVAYFLNFLLLVFLMKKKLGWRFSLKKTMIGKRIWNNLGFAQLGNVMSALSLYAPIYILSGFSAGIITSLSFAQQLSALPATLIIYQFSAVIGIKFNELYSQKKFTEISTSFVTTANFLIFIMLPVSVVCFMFPREIMTIVLKRGKFDEAGIEHASLFFKYLALALPLTAINTLFARLFMASHKIKEAFWYQVLLNGSLICSIYLSIQHFGVLGYPFSILSIYSLNVLFCYFLEKRFFNMIGYYKILKKFALLILINIALGAIVFAAVRSLDVANEWLILMIAVALYGCLLLGANYLFRLNEDVSKYVYNFFLPIKERIVYHKRNENGI